MGEVDVHGITCFCGEGGLLLKLGACNPVTLSSNKIIHLESRVLLSRYSALPLAIATE